jgi:hypothetical protein
MTLDLQQREPVMNDQMRLMGTQSGHDTQASIKPVSKLTSVPTPLGGLGVALGIALRNAPTAAGAASRLGTGWGRAEP